MNRISLSDNKNLADVLTVSQCNRLLRILAKNGLTNQNLKFVLDGTIPVYIGEQNIVTETWPVQYLSDSGMRIFNVEDTESVFNMRFENDIFTKLKIAREKLVWLIMEAVQKEYITAEELNSLDPHIVIDPGGLTLEEVYNKFSRKFTKPQEFVWSQMSKSRCIKGKLGVSFRVRRKESEQIHLLINEILKDTNVDLVSVHTNEVIVGWLIDRNGGLINSYLKNKVKIACGYSDDGKNIIYAGVNKKGIVFSSYKSTIIDPFLTEYATLKIYI